MCGETIPNQSGLLCNLNCFIPPAGLGKLQRRRCRQSPLEIFGTIAVIVVVAADFPRWGLSLSLFANKYAGKFIIN